ncbi:MAG TPA: FHA domain-containing protein [Polyangiales bacterium]|nr:FHA domain-containing protein [Polyangiales bacterium]
MGVRFVVRAREGVKPGSQVEFPFEQTRIVLGRGPAADVRIPHRTVSEFHATVQLHGDVWQLADAGSTNGTKLNGTRLTGDRPKRLRDGDRIELGAYELSFHTAVFVPEPVSAERTAELARRLLRDAQGSAALPAPRLCVVSGPHTGAVLEIADAPSRAIIGCKQGCELLLETPDISPEHAEVIHDLDGVLIRGVGDHVIGVAGQLLRSRRLRDGDELALGDTQFFFEEPAQVAIDALRNEPDLPFLAAPPVRTETEPLPAEPPLLRSVEPVSGLQPSAAGRADADLLIYALAAIVLIASALGLLMLLQAQ